MPHDDDDEALRKLGYAQELTRAMGGFATFALSFSIISVLTGVITTYDVALRGAGGIGLGVGWPLAAAGTLLVALAMAELASAFPTAGALYHWAALLGGPGAGWFTASTNLLGQVAIVAAIDLGCARELAGVVGLGERAHLPLFGALLASHAAVNLASVRLVARLNDVSAVVHMAGVALLAGLLLAFGRAQPAGFLVDTSFTARPDGDVARGFVNALMLGMYTFTGYDASAHVSEETHDAARRAPVGIVLSVLVSAVFGYALVVALTLAVRDLPATAAGDHAALSLLEGALGARVARPAMGLAVFAMWCCGLSSLTSASRTLFAFARDEGVPFSARVRRVGARTRTPHVALAVMTLLPFALVVAFAQASSVAAWLGAAIGAEAFDGVVATATTGLYVSYAVPIALGAVARARGKLRHRGPFHLGRLSVPIAVLAVAYAAAVVLCVTAPPNGHVALGLAVTFAVLGVVYRVRVRGRFRGPPVDLAHFERGAGTDSRADVRG